MKSLDLPAANQGAGARAYRQAFLEGLKPEPAMTVSEWADAHRILSSRSGAEEGPWRTDRTPYLREIMDALSAHSPVQEVVFMKGSQVGGTELGNNWLGYTIHKAPGPFMVVMPTEKVQKRKSRQTLDALIQDTPVLAARVARYRSRDPGNTTLMKVFPGGMLVLASAESAADLRSSPIRYLMEDELDAFPEELEGEGDPAALAERGTMTFSRNRKIYKTSTPTVQGRSRIEAAFQETDRRYYHVPCPRCGFFQRITWKHLKFEKGEDELAGAVAQEIKNGRRAVWMECESCKGRIEEHEKEFMLPRGKWIPEDPSRGGVVRGYHLSALYSPFGMYSWRDSVVRFLKWKNHPTRFRAWVNQDLGESYKETGEAPEWRPLYDRRERYAVGIVPIGGRLLTAGVDIQADRIEYEVMASGARQETWSVEYGVQLGKPTEAAAWAFLDRLLERAFEFEDKGPRQHIAALGVDAGNWANQVYLWVRRHASSARVYALRGRVGTMVTIGNPTAVDIDLAGRKIQRGCLVWPVDTGMLKEELYARLAIAPPLDDQTPFAEGYCHFPSYGPEYFKGLVSEVLVRRRLKSGRITHDWELLRGVERNEPLDCRVYARAMACRLGVDAFTEEDWKAVRTIQFAGGAPGSPEPPPDTEPPRRERSERWRRAGRRRT